MQEHTPGHWAQGPTVLEGVAVSADGYWIGIAYRRTLAPRPIGQGEAEANARLMATAPDLLDACRQALAALPQGEARAAVEAAIARAEGTAPATTRGVSSETHHHRCTE